MANLDAPFGLRPVRMVNGGKIPMHKYRNKGATTAIFAGDLVILQAADKAVLRHAATTGSDDVVGVAANYVKAGTALQDVWVYDHPMTVFEVQSDGTTAADHVDHVGAVASMVATAGNTTTGRSKMELKYSSITSTGTASNNIFKIVGVSQNVKNDSSSSHSVMEVLLLKHFYTYRSASL